MLFSHLVRMDESADARRILTTVPQSDCKKLVGRPHTYWLATMKNDLSYHNLSVEYATELALDRLLLRLFAASRTTVMMMMMMMHKMILHEILGKNCHILV